MARHGDDDLDGIANQAEPDWAPDQRDEHAHDDEACDRPQAEPGRWVGVTRDPDELEANAVDAERVLSPKETQAYGELLDG